MKQPDQQRAKRLIRLREEKATFRWTYLLGSFRLWVIATVIMTMLIYTLVGDRGPLLDRAIWLVAGVFVGRILRDYIWLKDVVDAAPFLERVLDWTKVEALASQPEVR